MQESAIDRKRLSLLGRLVWLFEHPATVLVTAAGLFVTSLHEVITTFEASGLGAHHGLLFYSLVHGARALRELREGAALTHHALGHKPTSESG